MSKYIGFSNSNKEGLAYTVTRSVKTNSKLKYEVEFEGTGYTTIRDTKEVVSGCIKDKLHPHIAGVGFQGVGKYTSKKEHMVCYQAWSDMIKRCYAPKLERIARTYKGVTVHKDWFNYQNYADWYFSNYRDGWVIDKDLLFLDNKVYSDKTCVCIPRELNSFLGGGIKNGVHFNNIKKVWVAQCNNSELTYNGNKKQTYLGSYKTEEEALAAYKVFKLDKTEMFQEKFGAVVPDRVFHNIKEFINNLSTKENI